MFAIIDDSLYIAPANCEWSHRDWLMAEKVIPVKNNPELLGLTRGFADQTGLYFYEGDFALTERAEREVMGHLNELALFLGVTKELHLFGGELKGKIGEHWLGIKDYGSLKDILSK